MGQIRFAACLARLTPDEIRVMQLLIEGLPNKTIAKQLDIGLRTVERRRQQILEKMAIGSLPELAAVLTSHRRGETVAPNY